METINRENITYERNVEHCEPSQYVKMVTVKTVEPALNSDNLSRLEFNEMGWNAVAQRNRHFVGEQVLFIPPDSVLPVELTELLGITKYTSKGRIRVTRLRGNRSEGLIVDPAIVEPYLPYIMKWEDPPEVRFSGDALPNSDIPYDFIRFYKMPNILNEPYVFRVGEDIWYSEKIHGTNMRFGELAHPQTGEYQYYVGSHNVVLKEGDNIYWNIFNKFFRDCIPYDYVFFCEPFGPNVQHLTYGRKEHDVRIFAISHRGEYLPVDEVIFMCQQYGLPMVDFKKITFTDLEAIRELADAPSVMTTDHYREGIVMVSDEYPEKMAKCIGMTYLTKKEGKRTERH